MHTNSHSSPGQAVEDALDRVAAEYRDEGYEVIVRTQVDQVPAFAAGFRPDPIATRGNERVLIAIKRLVNEWSEEDSISKNPR